MGRGEEKVGRGGVGADRSEDRGWKKLVVGGTERKLVKRGERREEGRAIITLY